MSQLLFVDLCAFGFRDRGGLAAYALDDAEEAFVPDDPPVGDLRKGGNRVERCVHDELRPQLRSDVARHACDDSDVREKISKADEIRFADVTPRAEDRFADAGMAYLARPDKGDAVRRCARNHTPRGPRDCICISKAILKRDEDRSLAERTQGDHRIRGVVGLRRDHDEFRFRVLRNSGRSARFRDDRCLPGDSESVRFDRRDVLPPPDEGHIMPLGEEASEETAHRARAEHEKFHDSSDAGAIQNGFAVRFASCRFYINRKMNDFLSIRYF